MGRKKKGKSKAKRNKKEEKKLSTVESVVSSELFGTIKYFGASSAKIMIGLPLLILGLLWNTTVLRINDISVQFDFTADILKRIRLWDKKNGTEIHCIPSKPGTKSVPLLDNQLEDVILFYKNLTPQLGLPIRFLLTGKSRFILMIITVSMIVTELLLAFLLLRFIGSKALTKIIDFFQY